MDQKRMRISVPLAERAVWEAEIFPPNGKAWHPARVHPWLWRAWNTRPLPYPRMSKEDLQAIAERTRAEVIERRHDILHPLGLDTARFDASRWKPARRSLQRMMAYLGNAAAAAQAECEGGSWWWRLEPLGILKMVAVVSAAGWGYLVIRGANLGNGGVGGAVRIAELKNLGFTALDGDWARPGLDVDEETVLRICPGAVRERMPRNAFIEMTGKPWPFQLGKVPDRAGSSGAKRRGVGPDKNAHRRFLTRLEADSAAEVSSQRSKAFSEGGPEYVAMSLAYAAACLHAYDRTRSNVEWRHVTERLNGLKRLLTAACDPALPPWAGAVGGKVSGEVLGAAKAVLVAVSEVKDESAAAAALAIRVLGGEPVVERRPGMPLSFERLVDAWSNVERDNLSSAADVAWRLMAVALYEARCRRSGIRPQDVDDRQTRDLDDPFLPAVVQRKVEAEVGGIVAAFHKAVGRPDSNLGTFMSAKEKFGTHWTEALSEALAAVSEVSAESAKLATLGPKVALIRLTWDCAEIWREVIREEPSCNSASPFIQFAGAVREAAGSFGGAMEASAKKVLSIKEFLEMCELDLPAVFVGTPAEGRFLSYPDQVTAGPAAWRAAFRRKKSGADQEKCEARLSTSHK